MAQVDWLLVFPAQLQNLKPLSHTLQLFSAKFKGQLFHLCIYTVSETSNKKKSQVAPPKKNWQVSKV